MGLDEDLFGVMGQMGRFGGDGRGRGGGGGGGGEVDDQDPKVYYPSLRGPDKFSRTPHVQSLAGPGELRILPELPTPAPD